MKNQSARLRILRCIVLGGMMAAGSLPAVSQQVALATTETAEIQEIVVTGSRIAAPNEVSTSPIDVITAKDILLTGKADISDILYQLPQNFNNSLGQDFSGRTSGLTTAGGLTTADLRGLGPNRTLVLINGRRLGVGDANTAIASPAPDLDQIPTFMVERIDVVTGGASATYGSDAIAGVVNFIMKKNFQGIQIDGQIGEDWHNNNNSFVQGLNTAFGSTPPTGSVKDGRNRNFDVIMGTNFADGAGNITGYLGYLESDPVTSGARDFGACQLAANSTLTGAVCSGSSNSNQWTPNPINASAQFGVVGNQLLPWPATGQNPPALFNSQPYIYIAREDQRYLGGVLGHLDLNDAAKPYLEFNFMNDKTTQFIAPSALFKDSNPNDPISGNYNINCDNPLLSSQEAAVLCSPAQIAAAAAAPGTPCSFTTPPGGNTVLSPNCTNVRIGRRNVEGEGRNTYFEHTNYRAVLGSTGDFLTAWSYDAYGSYYYSTLFTSNNNYLNFQNIDNALQVTGTLANPVCISGGSCVPYNIFGTGPITPQQLQYLYLSGTAYGTVTERILHADITGQLGKYGIKLPTANDGIAINVGWEDRRDTEDFQPDAAELGGQLSGFGGASAPIDQGIGVSEEFVELRAPLVQGRPFAKDLVVDAGIRRSDYSTSGVVNTYKIELQYAPLDDFRFRGSFQRAIRAPSIVELYNPPNVGAIGFSADPCAPPITASLAECAHTGVTPTQYANGTIPQLVGNQVSALTGGNTQLQPEVATSYTLGFNITPTSLPEFTASVDYYHINLKDEIGEYPASILLNQCLITGLPQYCSQIVRSPTTGGLTGATVAGGGYIVQTNVNIGSELVSGFDLQANYKLPLNSFGTLLFSLSGTYLLHNYTTPSPQSLTYDCSGLFGSTCETLNPKWRQNLRVTWSTPWEVEVSAFWRYLGKVSLDNNSYYPSLAYAEFGAYNYFNAQIPAYNYLDLSVSWNVLKQVQLRAGINNLFDKNPPIVT
ncbi:MAG TPA: TonB-dependent receptor, partial [Steroidobacteraceae bacterium]|nr:TonB-dependent receptor [Steroidobacteraceae bacterium]